MTKPVYASSVSSMAKLTTLSEPEIRHTLYIYSSPPWEFIDCTCRQAFYSRFTRKKTLYPELRLVSAIRAWDFTALSLEQQVNVTGNDYKHLSDAKELPMMTDMNNVGNHKKVCSI